MQILFNEVRIGQTFFDPQSGESFEKTGEFTAVMVSNLGDAFDSDPDIFSANEMVEI
jgi:hypothetical protein